MAKPGTHSMAVAIKKLVEAATLDQRNEWFVLVGETTGAPAGLSCPAAGCGMVLQLPGGAGTAAAAAAAAPLHAARALAPSLLAVPLYHPLMFYQQLTSERKSRVDACLHEVRDQPCALRTRLGGGSHKLHRAKGSGPAARQHKGTCEPLTCLLPCTCRSPALAAPLH